jgi:hypothetical protein
MVPAQTRHAARRFGAFDVEDQGAGGQDMRGTRVAPGWSIMETILDNAAKVVPDDHASTGEIALEALVGAAAGAATGLLAGPPGILAGAVIGGVVGASAATALHRDHDRAEHDAELDRDIGIIGGNLGEASPDAPASTLGVFHAASLGIATSTGVEPAEGLIQSIEEE